QKTFNTTIHSVGIMVQSYNNSSVVCAGGGVRSIADIQSASYSKSEDDALLLLKADKSTTYTKTEDDALLLLKADKSTTYTKIETNNLLNNKADTGVSYTKGEDDALLLLKADKTQLIDSYTKGETNNLLNNKADTGVSYTKGEDDALLLLKADKSTTYTKTQDDALLLLKADKSTTYTKTEDDALLLLKADKSTTYTKTEDDALLLLKADKTQLIDSYTKGETNNLLNNKADTGVSYTKGEDDALLLLKADKSTTYTKTQDDALLLLKADKTQLIDSYTKTETNNLLSNNANQSTTYTKIETDQLISQVDVGDVDLTDYYNKTKTDELLSEKADSTELSNYMTLGTSQTINANKTFNNACRFVSSIDGMSTVTGSSFVKSGADDTVVLYGAGGTKTISEFADTPTDLSNYYAKAQTFSRTEANNKFVRFDGSIQQTITGRLKYVSPFDYQDETRDPVANTYLTQSEVDVKLTNVVTTNTTQSITGAKTFNSNVSAAGFAKTGKDDTSVLLAGGGDQLLSSFGGVQVEDITNLILNLHSNITFNYLKLVRIVLLFAVLEILVLAYLLQHLQALNIQFNWQRIESHQHVYTHIEKFEQLLIQQQLGVLMMKLAYNLVGCFDNKSVHITYQTSLLELFLNYEMSYEIGSVYLDEALLEAAGLLEFPEYYAYIIERVQEPVQPAQRIPIGEQTLQKQVKDNDDILFSTNEEFVPPVPNATQKLDLNSQLERSSFLASSGSVPQLIVYGDRVTLTVSYETTGLFPNGYIFKSYPEFARPKAGDKVIALVGTDTTNKNSIFCYIDQNGPFI
ncbi:MAG: hypothetical protein EZS28_035737, partial [Streblomastix strix]